MSKPWFTYFFAAVLYIYNVICSIYFKFGVVIVSCKCYEATLTRAWTIVSKLSWSRWPHCRSNEVFNFVSRGRCYFLLFAAIPPAIDYLHLRMRLFIRFVRKTKFSRKFIWRAPQTAYTLMKSHIIRVSDEITRMKY